MMNPVFLLDVDNTLLDNDRFSADLDARLRADFGEPERLRYRQIYQRLRDRLGYADYLGALQEFREGVAEHAQERLLGASEFMLDYPFADRVYPNVAEVIGHLDGLGTTAILSDGDIVFQPHKIRRSGLSDLVQGRVMVTVHKEQCLDALQRRWPADHYVLVDDKPSLLSAMKKTLGSKATTVFVQQGHYADEADLQNLFGIDISIASIAEMANMERSRFLPQSTSATSSRAPIPMEAP